MAGGVASFQWSRLFGHFISSNVWVRYLLLLYMVDLVAQFAVYMPDELEICCCMWVAASSGLSGDSSSVEVSGCVGAC